ncbi:MAG: FxLYD domain-containing protein [Fusobacterium gastrosuis]|uniref:FxLYD domain-containing protein n=1 Tax=Fusobacterium gastrosuis TaxID=1755100 RepID=UPI002A8DD70E|nr:FxLYD domain-containing protein [Fusobacteriaceae bacterium]MDY4010634.1 FxLYD domain-containing protein [Fusobacterium gastrosuis]MDY5794769.1 FxLYD domain-containing protein [Fusobacterium gastrosuis]
MKKIIFTLGLAVLFSSCIIGSVVGGTISAAGSIVGGTISATGKIIGALIGDDDGEIKAKGVKYEYSDVKVEIDQDKTIVTGTVYHNTSTKENVRIEIPCYDKDKKYLGDAIDTIEELPKKKKWKFKAVIERADVKYANIKEAYISSSN